MAIRDILLRATYDSANDDILNDFYIPVLAQGRRYRRLAGFFSSSSLAIAARGISGLIANGGRMELVVGAKLQKNDVEAIKSGIKDRDSIISNLMIKDIDDIHDQMIRDHVRALAWLVANQLIDIKVAIVTDENQQPLDEKEVESRGIFHQKVGIIEDSNGDIISFSGSVNESATAWLNNIEEFKVFRSWIDSEKQYLESDIRKFEQYWNGNVKNMIIKDIPSALREKLIAIAPPNFEELRLALPKQVRKPELRGYQQKAIEAWFNNSNRGLLEMATGTGKTFTAIACLRELRNRTPSGKLAVVITCPYTHLIEQWQKSLYIWGFEAVEAYGGVSSWRRRIENEVLDLNHGISNFLIVLTTHDTFSSEVFVNIVRQIETKIMLIADEVHAVGSEIRKTGLLENYTYRLGLSATPRRYFDDEGTDTLIKFFGGTIFSFTLADAIAAGFLVPYYYYPQYVELTDRELKEYRKFSRKIAMQYEKAKNDAAIRELMELYQIQRQKIIVNAQNKMSAFKEILDQIGPSMDHCLIYCSDQQIDEVQEILNQRMILNHRITFRESVDDRKLYLEKFDKGDYKALVAINVLDEGVDIPSTKMAIILASTGNPKQYIQRRGRILRQFVGSYENGERKEYASIYDVIVIPSLTAEIDEETFEMERKIIAKELVRYEDMARDSKNPDFALKSINTIKKRYGI